MPHKISRLVLYFEGGLILVAWALGLLLDSPAFAGINWNWRDLVAGVAATLPLLLAMWLCVRTEWGPIRRLMREVDERLIPPFSHSGYFELAILSIAAGVGEEALFRGVLQVSFVRWLDLWAGLSAAAVLFGLGHLITPAYAVLAALIGFYLGGIFVIFDNLLPAIVAHALYDFLALVYLIGRHQARRNISTRKSEGQGL